MYSDDDCGISRQVQKWLTDWLRCWKLFTTSNLMSRDYISWREVSLSPSRVRCFSLTFDLNQLASDHPKKHSLFAPSTRFVFDHSPQRVSPPFNRLTLWSINRSIPPSSQRLQTKQMIDGWRELLSQLVSQLLVRQPASQPLNTVSQRAWFVRTQLYKQTNTLKAF